MSFSRFSRRTFVLRAFSAAILFGVFASAAFAGDVKTIKINFDRESQIYAVGEDATFTVAPLDEGDAAVKSGVMTVKITNHLHVFFA